METFIEAASAEANGGFHGGFHGSSHGSLYGNGSFQGSFMWELAWKFPVALPQKLPTGASYTFAGFHGPLWGSTYSRLPQIRNMYFDVLALLPLVAMRFLVLFKCTRHLSVFHDKVETY